MFHVLIFDIKITIITLLVSAPVARGVFRGNRLNHQEELGINIRGVTLYFANISSTEDQIFMKLET